jgi:hypothetical protein
MDGSKTLAYEVIGAGAEAESAADTNPRLSTIASIAIATTTTMLLNADFMLKAISEREGRSAEIFGLSTTRWFVGY